VSHHRTHTGEAPSLGGGRIPLEEAALGAVPALHPNRSAAAFHFVDRRRTVFGAEGREGPSGRIEHSHAALPVDQHGHVLQAGIALGGDFQNVLGLL